MKICPECGKLLFLETGQIGGQTISYYACSCGYVQEGGDDPPVPFLIDLLE